MFVIRPVREQDLESIFELSGLMKNFINLPRDRKELETKISRSLKSFSAPSKKLEENYYLFVLEDLEKGIIIGTSLIHGKHGTEREPHFYLKVDQERKFSQTLNTGFIHGTLKFGHVVDGWTEIGGLILHPDYRGHEDKLGKQLSFIRFLYIALNPDSFTDVIHTELMPPFDAKGKSPLWEAIGRRFLNMNYHDADLLSRQNKEFILSLYPTDTIYGTLLPTDAKNAIGKVGKETEPVRNMLEKIGFKYVNEVDPFDGGPHYRADISDISLVKNMKNAKVIYSSDHQEYNTPYLITFYNNGEFLGLRAHGQLSNDIIMINRDKKIHMILEEGTSVNLTQLS